jgi:DNA-binding MarR family transcriptional regulator
VAAIDEAVQLIRTRLDELNFEKKRLERALGELGSSTAPRRGRPPGHRKPGPKPGRRRAAASKAAGKPGRRKAGAPRIPRAEREQAILAFLKAHPSASAKEIAAGVGTTANYVNNMLTGLRKQGRLVRKADRTQVEVQAEASSSAAAKPAAAKSSARKKPGRKKGSSKARAKRALAKSASK